MVCVMKETNVLYIIKTIFIMCVMNKTNILYNYI